VYKPKLDFFTTSSATLEEQIHPSPQQHISASFLGQTLVFLWLCSVMYQGTDMVET